MKHTSVCTAKETINKMKRQNGRKCLQTMQPTSNWSTKYTNSLCLYKELLFVYTNSSIWKNNPRDFPAEPVAKTPCSQRRPGITPWSGNWIPRAETSASVHQYERSWMLQPRPSMTEEITNVCSVTSVVYSQINKHIASVVSNSLRPHGPQPTRLLCPWDFPGKNTGVGCQTLLHGIFPTRWSNPVSCTEGGFFTTSAILEAPNK